MGLQSSTGSGDSDGEQAFDPLGATGQSIVLYDIFKEAGYRLDALVDNNPDVASPFDGVPVLHGMRGLNTWMEGRLPSDLSFAVAIGGSRGEDRVELSTRLMQLGLQPLQALHPSSRVAKEACIGKGAQVLVGSIICARAVLGDWVIVNTGASIDHECKVGSGAHIGPRATLCGCVEVGNFAFIGAGSVVLPRIRIGAKAIVGAGSVVTKDVPEGAIVFGNPARIASAAGE